MEKGDIVLIKASVETDYERDDFISVIFGEISDYDEIEKIHEPKGKHEMKKCLFRYPFPAPDKGIIVGWSYRATGHYYPGGDEEPASLMEDNRHRVWLVQPLTKDQRWLKPMACLEEDLEIVDRGRFLCEACLAVVDKRIGPTEFKKGKNGD